MNGTSVMTTPDALSSTVDPLQLRRTFACFPSGLAALCSLQDGAPTGMVFSSFTSVSIEPPLVSVCVAHASETWPVLRRSAGLGVSILGDKHATACRQLSSRTGDRFAGLDIDSTPEGAVFLSGAVAWLDCVIYHEMRAGDHNVVLLRVLRLSGSVDAQPLVFHGSQFHSLVSVEAS